MSLTDHDDTGMCVPESVATLALQQRLLMTGKRDVQMFPLSTLELPLPDGLSRHQNARGVFHFRDNAISTDAIDALSQIGRENDFLNLGPISKPEVAMRQVTGEQLLCITECTSDGVEIRSAAGTDKTIDIQRDYFERTKEPGSVIVVTDMRPVLIARLAEMT